MTPPLVVLGGGPAGLAVAFYATRAGVPVVLLERGRELGGLCRTFRCGPHRYDAGAHRFHDRDPAVTRDVRALLGDRLAVVTAPSRIHTGRRFVDFPPTPLNMLFSGGVWEAIPIALDLLRGRAARRAHASFADFAVGRFGRTLARRFLLDYSEKLWGLPAEQLAPEIATRRLQGMTLRSLVVELIAPGRRADHIDGHFLYPTGGYGEIPAHLAAGVPAAALRTEHEVIGLECRGDRIAAVRLAGRPALEVPGRLVATLPLTVLVRLLGDVLPAAARRAAAALRFRSVRLVFLRLARARVSSNASIYLPDPATCVARVTEPKNRSTSMAPADETALVAEVPCFPGEALATVPDAALVERVVRELAGVGLVRPPEVIEWRHHVLPNAYPVYALGHREAVGTVVGALGAIRNLDLLGRGGLFWYSHLHDQLRLGRRYVGELADRPAAGDAWRPGGDEASGPA
jgi:protoporphyrinogen oxidase